MIQEYFSKEKKIAFVTLALGILATTVGSAFLISARPPFYFGMALLFILVGIAEIIVGARVTRNVDELAYESVRLFEKDPVALATQETERINSAANLHHRGYIIGVLLSLAGLMLLSWIHNENFWSGLGCGAVLQGSATQLYYRMIQRRNLKYLEYLNTLLP